MKYKDVLNKGLTKKAQDMYGYPSMFGYNAPQGAKYAVQQTQDKAENDPEASPEVQGFKVTKTDIPEHALGAQLFRDPKKTGANALNSLVNAFVWGAPRALAGLYNLGADTLEQPGKLYGLARGFSGGKFESPYNIPHFDTSNWYSTHFGADPLSGQVGAFVGEFGLPAAGPAAVRHVRGVANARNARNAEQIFKTLGRASGLDTKDKLRLLRTSYNLGGGKNPSLFSFRPERYLRNRWTPFSDIALKGQIAFMRQHPKTAYRGFQNYFNPLTPKFIAKEKWYKDALPDIPSKIRGVGKSTIGKVVADNSADGSMLLFKGSRPDGQVRSAYGFIRGKNQKPESLLQLLKGRGTEDTARWLGGMPETSLSPTYSGAGGRFDIIKVSPKDAPGFKTRLQPHMGGQIPAGSSPQIYDNLRKTVQSTGSVPGRVGHYAIGTSPEYQFVSPPGEWHRLAKQSPVDTWFLGDYHGKDVSRFRRGADPLPKAVADIPVYRRVYRVLDPRYFYSRPWWAEKIKTPTPGIISGVGNTNINNK